MIISGYEFTGKEPFKNIYFTGLVRDKKRQKMSKQLGNSPDPLKLINSYGADAVRVGLMLSSRQVMIYYLMNHFASKVKTLQIKFGIRIG